MLQKLQKLQNEVIDLSQKTMDKDLLIQEKERLYVELKNVLGRQPGPEVAEQLELYNHNLKQKLKQQKQMRGELKMFQEQVMQHKRDIERLAEKHRELKNSYFQNMRSQTLQGTASGIQYSQGYNSSDTPAAMNSTETSQNTDERAE